ncbi:ATP-binding protein, partial [Acinetobacter radioresistens]|nr:ATP-binding protein [Acinetobacter radioresistens]
MKISKIDVQGLLGAQQVTLALTSPVVLVAGDNAAGKSSVREAVRAAFLG